MNTSGIGSSSLFEPLSYEDLDRLDAFLLDRITEQDAAAIEASNAELDEGILDISELDGFFTAIVSGPRVIPPSEWLPALWGDVEPEWETEEEFAEVFQLLVRFMNSISGALMEPTFEFEPTFLEREVEGKTYTIVDEWCEGYMRGVSLSSMEWDVGGGTVLELLRPIMLFSSALGWAGLDDLKDSEVVELQQMIPPAVRTIHAFWLEQRGQEDAPQPFVHETPRIGRNDPCPCGSGKKYKKCCLH